MPIRSALSIALLLNLMIGLAAPVAAQSDSGSLSVRVTDETGAAVPGATVVVRQVATGSTRELTTDRSGRALFSMLPSGTYDSTVSLAGFNRHRPDITAGTRVLGETAAYPGLPLITSSTTTPATMAALREALAWVTLAPAMAQVRDDLFIRAFEALPRPSCTRACVHAALGLARAADRRP